MSWPRWLPTFLAFPLGGLIVVQALGSLDGPLAAAAGGAIAGAVIGTGQWLALRPRGTRPHWILATSGAMAAGSFLAALLTGAGTGVPDLVAAGAVTGAAVGAAQARFLCAGRTAVAGWTAVTAGAWALGWLVTSSIGVDVERGYIVFGAAGAITATVLTGLALRRIVAPAASVAVAA